MSWIGKKPADQVTSGQQLADGTVSLSKLVAGIFAVGATGLAKFADGFFTADAAGRAKVADGFVTQAKLAAGVAGNGPAFFAYQTGTPQSISGGTPTKVAFNAETFDTNSNYDSTTNFRFQPLVAGYYQINATVTFVGTAALYSVMQIKKNGLTIFETNTQRSNANYNAVCSSLVVYLNGSTDYVEIYAFENVNSTVTLAGTIFSGALVRAA